MAKVTQKQMGAVTEWTVIKSSPRKGDRRTGQDRPQRAHGEKVERHASNISRAKARIKEYALCNPWRWFVTLTIDPQKYDRTDLDAFYKDFAAFVHARQRKSEIRYIVIPEYHSDKQSYHFHALMSGIPFDELEVVNGRLNWKPYFTRFGFSMLEPIEDATRCAFYMTKYITKDLGQAVPAGGQLFRASKGLARAKLLAVHDDLASPADFASDLREYEDIPVDEYETEYIRKKTVRS